MIEHQTPVVSSSNHVAMANPPLHSKSMNAQLYKVDSKCLKETIFINDLTAKDEDSLRSLYFELRADRHSMIEAEKSIVDRIKKDDFSDDESREREQRKLHGIRKKMSIYLEFYKSIRIELNLRFAIDSATRVKLAMQAKRSGLDEDQVKALLDSAHSNAVLTESCTFLTTLHHKRKSAESSIALLRTEIMKAELLKLLVSEFEASEIESIEREAMESVDKAFDWNRLGFVLPIYAS